MQDFNDIPSLKHLLANMPSSVSIITAWDADQRPVGATLSAVMSLSLDPPMMVAAFDQGSTTLAALECQTRFLIHIVSGTQTHVATRFAGKGGDKFAEVAWKRGLHDLPQLAGAAGVIACEVVDIIRGGDHKMVLGRVRAIDHDIGSEPLVYHRRQLRPMTPHAGV